MGEPGGWSLRSGGSRPYKGELDRSFPFSGEIHLVFVMGRFLGKPAPEVHGRTDGRTD